MGAHIRRLSAVLILLILIVVSSTALTEISCIISVKHNVALAVASTPKGYKGVPTNVSVYLLYPGSGEVYVSSKPLSELDFQSSAQIAYLVASHISNINPRNFDVLISIEAPTTIIGGPSAGGVMTVTMAAALMNLSLRKDVVMTGTINLDGIIGPVGGLFEKLQAAKEVGAKYFLVPAGQSLTYVTKIIEERRGNIIIQRVVKELVNLTEIGKEYGIHVIEVGNIYEALKYFTGLDLGSSLPKIYPSLDQEYVEVLVKWISILNKSYVSTLSNVKSNINEVTETYKTYINKLVKESESSYRNFTVNLGKGKYYSAISDLFFATYLIDFTNTLLSFLLSNDSNLINKIIEEINNSLIKLQNHLFNINVSDLNDVVILAESRLRFYEAYESFNISLKYLKEGRVVEGLKELTYSKWRLFSIRTWLDFLGRKKSVEVSTSTIKKLSDYLILYAESSYQYAELLLQSMGRSSNNLIRAKEFLMKSKDMLVRGDYYTTLSYSIISIASSLTAIHESYSGNIETTVSNLKDIIYMSYALAVKDNLTVLPALSYFERGLTFENLKDYISATYFYELSAITLRSHYLIKLLQENVKEKTNVFEQTPPQNVGTPNEDKSIENVATISKPSRSLNIIISIIMIGLLTILLFILLLMKHE